MPREIKEIRATKPDKGYSALWMEVAIFIGGIIAGVSLAICFKL